MNQEKLTVEKIGGTSIADTDAVLNNIFLHPDEEEERYNRAFVVSAYSGITDLLLEHKKTGKSGVYAHFASDESDWSWGDALSEVSHAMRRKNKEIFEDASDLKRADDFVRERIEGVRSCLVDLQRLCSYGHFRLDEHLLTVREMLAGLGEAHSAHNTTLLLRRHNVNAVFVDLTGWRDDDQPGLDERIMSAFKGVDLSKQLPIVTGYAHCSDGLMKQFDRGYSEVTFARLAVLLNADEAIIHKEFHLSSADPKLVGIDKVRTIGRTNYDVADQLSNMGMEAVHPSAAKGLRQAEIPLRVKNTFEPEHAGTEFCGEYVSEKPCTEIVTGLRSIFALEFFEQDMVRVKGFDEAILDSLKRHSVRIVSKSSNANTITHYLAGSLKAVKRVVAALEEKYPAASITTRRVSIVSAIGSDMKVKGLTARAAAALDAAGVEVLGLHQVMRNVDLQFVVEEDSFEDAVRALHKALVEEAQPSSAANDAEMRAA